MIFAAVQWPPPFHWTAFFLGGFNYVASQPCPNFVKGFVICKTFFAASVIDIGIMLEAIPETDCL